MPQITKIHWSILTLTAAVLLAIVLFGLPRAKTAVVEGAVTTPYPILFVTQVPIAADFTTIGSTFGNHKATLQSTGRGGDLYIRYPDGTLKNLTAAAGYGMTGFQGDQAIAVRDPAVHWDGSKAVFSMVIGGPSKQYEYEDYYWQLYEISGLGLADTPVITKVPHQPQNFNNISPIYGTDDRIIFTSDRPRSGERHLYPQRDEYESAPTNTGLWSLDPTTGDLFLMNHAPSGDFSPLIDSTGRVVFTQWDHLQRDQQADAHALDGRPPNESSFNYSDESAGAAILNDRTEVFPEPRGSRTDLLAGTNMVGHRFNHFFPWTIEQDGTNSEVLLHLGRHELHHYINRSINDDPNVIEYYGQYARTNTNSIDGMFHIEEDPTAPLNYFGVDAPEFGTHSGGYLIKIGVSGLNADQVVVEYVTDPDNGDGRYREPLPLSDGALLAVYTSATDSESGSGLNSDYDFHLVNMVSDGNGRLTAGVRLTTGINKSISYYNPDHLVSYNGPMWELNPVEVRPRARPLVAPFALAAPEQAVFDTAGVSVSEFQAYLEEHDLALIITRDVTTRDDLDQQQPFNLRIPGGVQSVADSGTIYDVSHMQIFQGEQIRGYVFGGSSPADGRRVIAQIMPLGVNPPANGPDGAVKLGLDGSMAALVPARRALSWQLVNPQGNPVVRERYWLTFQPGEIRTCSSCHGLSDRDQLGRTEPTNSPEALADLLEWWKFLTADDLEKVYLPAVER